MMGATPLSKNVNKYETNPNIKHKAETIETYCNYSSLNNIKTLTSSKELNNSGNNSYFDLYVQRKERESSQERPKSKSKGKVVNSKRKNLIKDENNKNSVKNTSINENKSTDVIPPTYPNSNNFNTILTRAPSATNLRSGSPYSGLNSIDLSLNRNLSPKSDFKFNNQLLIKSKSTAKIKTIKSKDKSTNDKNNDSLYTLDSQACFSSVNGYFQRRHAEAQDKLQKLKTEQMKKENEEIRDRPAISKNSKKIVEKLINNNTKNVFDRLTSKANERKKTEEIKKIEETTTKVKDKPSINETSEKLQRTIEDLYYWKEDLNHKKEEMIKNKNYVNFY